MVNIKLVLENNKLVDKKVLTIFENSGQLESAFMIHESDLSKLFKDPDSYILEFSGRLSPEILKQVRKVLKPKQKATVNKTSKSTVKGKTKNIKK